MFTTLRRTLHVGQKILNHKLTLAKRVGSEYVIENNVDSSSLFSKKSVVVAVPGAFTPTCSTKHLPPYIEMYEQFRSKGVEVYVLAVNDAFVMKRYGEDLKASLPLICDGSGLLTKALDAGLDLTDKGLGYRTRRFSFIVQDNTIQVVNDEGSGAFTDVSAATTVLSQIN
jgi:peroxiredoxin